MSALQQDAPRGFVTKTEHYKALARIDTLREQVSELREQLAAAKGAGLVGFIRIAIPALSPMESRFLAALYTAKSYLTYRAVYGSSEAWRSNGDADQENVVKCHICHMRRKLRDLRAPPTIETAYGLGYRLTPEGRRWLDDMISRATDDPGAITGLSRGKR